MHYEYERLDKRGSRSDFNGRILAKRKKIREDERKHKKKGSDDREESLMPFEFYMVSSLAWS